MRRLGAFDRLAHEEVRLAGVARDVALGAARYCNGRWLLGLGASSSHLRSAEQTELIFDLASVSKPFVAIAFARLVDRKLMKPDTVLSELVWESVGTPSADVTLEALLSHRAGLDAHRALYAPVVARRAMRRSDAISMAARARRPECRANLPVSGFPPLYSDLGYLLAGEALARASGIELDELVLREVSEPLGISAGSARQLLKGGVRFRTRVTPTEYVAFRGGVVRGSVHDENAWALAGHGLAGHAGLFGTVEDVLRFGMALIDALSGRRAAWLSRAAMERLLAPRPGGTLRLGFDSKSASDSAAGASASERTFGHLGFTGTSIWCDPMAEAVTVLLTNRVCPSRANLAIRKARPKIHEALFRGVRELAG
jgi:CubicO group peptidase (beta-lactamase class C family)